MKTRSSHVLRYCDMRAVARWTHAAEVQLYIISTTHWSSSVEFGITGYYDPGLLPQAGSQNTYLSKYPCLPNFNATRHLEPKIVMFNVLSWRPYWNSRWRPIHWSDLLGPAIFELSMSKYLCMQNSTLCAGCEHRFHISAPLIL